MYKNKKKKLRFYKNCLKKIGKKDIKLSSHRVWNWLTNVTYSHSLQLNVPVMMQKLQMKKESSHIWVISIPSQAPQVTILCGRQRQEEKKTETKEP